jgi:hypothetical protein
VFDSLAKEVFVRQCCGMIVLTICEAKAFFIPAPQSLPLRTQKPILAENPTLAQNPMSLPSNSNVSCSFIHQNATSVASFDGAGVS